MMNLVVVVVVLLGLFIIPGIINSILALKCPKCKEGWALKWQEIRQGDKCKYCGHFVSAEDFVPPKASYHRYMQKWSPITYKKKERE